MLLLAVGRGNQFARSIIQLKCILSLLIEPPILGSDKHIPKFGLNVF